MSDYFGEMLKVADNTYGSKVSDGVEAGDVESFIDTGSYILNAQLSGSIYGGLPSNKITAFAGESSTGKTFFVLGCVRQFLADNPTGGVIYFESESALTKDMIEMRGIDSKRMIILPVATVQEFRTQAIKILEKHLEEPEKDRPPMMMCLDSLGNLSTTKEMEDISDGKETRDMTRAQMVKGTFRVLTLLGGKAKVPLVVTNHTYDQIGTLFPQKIMGGGTGLHYAASSIVFLSKKKEKDGTEVIGQIIHCRTYKSRLTKEHKMVDVLLTYKEGLNRYYGLAELAEKYEIFKKVSTRLEMPDGEKVFLKTMLKNPTKYFTKDILDQLDEVAGKEFLYGEIGISEELDPEDDSRES
jgi:RecA/RadA recombinase